ncbi:hypothetical protein FSBG_00052 [Fusobacterium gonidiaformans 3-1-5R]|uniref:Uncharacterized protein n=1 Tax=Fusobacterium gonidiaformans 3-1-5R TaxID=469605 RepID=E5BEM4_9FUSO|nr:MULTISPECIES: hypothetical protein [Fusobacterium]EFS20555.1 hypothetical protein FSBG_00052 [Fusobacterium gonidiaformans 3-1-5R]KYM58570.1 hypothetical protein A2U09_07890 [Fusobacterium necrophorum subsp. funduliforme]
MNITKHALMRYVSRTHKIVEINEKTYDNFKRENEALISELEERLQEEFLKAEFFIKQKHEGHQEASFYINEDKMMTYVVANGNILTCYPIDFNLDEIGNLEMYHTLRKSFNREKELLKSMEESSVISKKEEEIKEIELEIQMLLSKQKQLEKGKRILENEIEVEELKINDVKNKISYIAERISRSSKKGL